MVIHQTLYNLFPLASFDVSKIAPLTPNYFVEKVMVPEVALRLILQDQESSVTSPDNVRAALQTLRESASYGNTMFPVDGADWDVDSSSTITSGAGKDKGKQKAIHGTNADDMNTAAERMVVERAKVRRREIEEAYAAESEGFMSDSRPKPRPRKKGVKTTMADEEMSGASEVESSVGVTESSVREYGGMTTDEEMRPRPRARAKVRRQDLTTDDEISVASDMDVVSSSPTSTSEMRPRLRAKAKVRRRELTTDDEISGASDMDVVPSSPTSTSERPKPRAKAKVKKREDEDDAMHLDPPPPTERRLPKASSSSVYDCNEMTTTLEPDDSDDDLDIIASSPALTNRKKPKFHTAPAPAPFPMDFASSSLTVDHTPKASKTKAERSRHR